MGHMLSVLTCIREWHDPRLVALAVLVCVLSSVTAMRFHGRNASGLESVRWMLPALTGVVGGGGVWATHFIAMLAFHPTLPVQFNSLVTAASLAVSVVGMGVGFAVAAHKSTARWQVAGGVLIGLSIVAMHFTGVAAIRSAFDIHWRWGYVAAAIPLALAGATAALFAGQRTTGLRGWIIPPALLIAGIVSLHFTAMTAIDLVPDFTLPTVHNAVDRHGVGVMISVVALLVITMASGLTVAEARGRAAGLRNLEAAFQGVPSGLAMFDETGRLVVWNEAYARLMANFSIIPYYGATRLDLVRQIAAAGHVRPEEGDTEAWARNIAAQRSVGSTRESLAPTGVWLRMEVAPLPNGGSVSVMTDITEAKKIADEMAEALDRAEAASRAKSEFLTNMSHEIRTPLNGVMGMAQVMEADELTDRQRERLKVVRESGGALLTILNDLLDLSKVQAGKLELDIGDVDMGKLAATVVAAFDGAASARDIALKVSVNEGVPGRWRGDGVRLRQILSNLVSNALKFTHEGEVRLSVERGNTGLEFRVFDTGIGIAPEHLPTLFDKFAQADATTTRRYGGTGLGLAICQELTALMGGTISVRSEVGKGSCFTVVIPTTYVGPSLADAGAAAAASVHASGRLRILAAEDNPTNQFVLRSLLEPLDCDLTIVSNGLEAVAAAAAGDFDAILMDVQMPEMNGVEATRTIRAQEAAAGRPRTPIVALSANVMSHQIEEYVQSGMDHWVAKPIELEKLYAGLDAVLSGGDAEEVEDAPQAGFEAA